MLVEEREEPLYGGNMTQGLVRVGQTVRRPSGPWTAAVHALLTHLADVGYDGAPKSLGLDDHGRHVVEWVDGEAAYPFLTPDDSGRALHEVGRLIHEFHTASELFQPPSDAAWNVVIEPDERNLVIHHDLAPWNFVRGGARAAVIDWDLAAPGSILWELAWSVHGFVPLRPEVPVAVAMTRLRHLAAGYGLGEADRERLVELLPRRALAMFDLLRHGHQHGVEPWATLWREQHGKAWQESAEFAQRHADDLRRALLD